MSVKKDNISMFKDKIKKLRLDKNISQSVIANYIGVTQQQYSRYESGTHEPSLATLVKIAHFYDVSIDYLLEYEHETNDIQMLISSLNDLDKEQLRELLIDILNVFLKVLN